MGNLRYEKTRNRRGTAFEVGTANVPNPAARCNPCLKKNGSLKAFAGECTCAIIYPMKIVLDTNILVGACMGSRAANRLVAACLQGRCLPLVGAALLAEYEDVIAREDVFSGCRLNLAERNRVLDALLSVAEWTRIYYLWRPNLADEGDNHLLELAVAGRARYLVTRNLKDFRQPQLLFPELEICIPETLLEKLA